MQERDKIWDQQAVERQMALAEQREQHKIDERRIEYQGSGRDEQEIGGRTKLTRMKKKRDRVFQLSSEADGSLGEGMLQKTVRILEEKMKEMNSRICVLEGNSDGEEKETSSSDGGYEKDWRWDNGGW